MTSLGWQNIQQLVNTSILNLAKNATEGRSSNGINNMLKVTYPKNPRKNIGARISHIGKITSINKTFQVEAPNLFNQLPLKLRDLSLTKEKFKTQLKKHMLTQHHLPTH